MAVTPEAKKQGDVLFVGLNSDASIRDEKGKDRPFIAEELRAAMLAALACVDYVIIIYASYRKVQNDLIDAIQPQIHANGPQYGPPESWIEWPIMQKYGTKGCIVQRRNDLSSSQLVQRIRATA